MEMKDLSCAQFLAQLASKAPTPGGGGTAALVGAAGVALGNMVGLPDHRQKEVRRRGSGHSGTERPGRCPAAGAGSAGTGTMRSAFAPLAAAYGLPKDTPEQAAHKAAVLEAALDGASAVPLQIMEKCAEGIALAEEVRRQGQRDGRVGRGLCAAVLCKAALQAASLNVFINTKLMTDRTPPPRAGRPGRRIAGRVCAPGRRDLHRRQRETPQ